MVSPRLWAFAGLCSTIAVDPWERAVKIVEQMTLAEKIQLCQGNKSLRSDYVGVVIGVERLGVPVSTHFVLSRAILQFVLIERVCLSRTY
jgi:hypothetical protein